jgi:phosphoglycolate phosphatase
MAYDAVVLDLDGTLLNTLPDITRIVNSVIEGIGMAPRGEEHIRKAVGSGVEAMLARLGVPGRWKAPLADEIGYRYANLKTSAASVYPGVGIMLDSMFRSGMPVCILSNKPSRAVLRSLEVHFPGRRFSAVRGALPGKPAKPGPDALLEILDEIGVEPPNALLAGDGEPDVGAAAAAGTGHIAVLWGYRDRSALERAGAVNFAETPWELLSFMGLLQ